MAFDLTCLATRKAKRRSAIFCGVGARLVTVFSCAVATAPLPWLCRGWQPLSGDALDRRRQSRRRDRAMVAALREIAATERAHRHARRSRVRHAAGDEQA